MLHDEALTSSCQACWLTMFVLFAAAILGMKVLRHHICRSSRRLNIWCSVVYRNTAPSHYLEAFSTSIRSRQEAFSVGIRSRPLAIYGAHANTQAASVLTGKGLAADWITQLSKLNGGDLAFFLSATAGRLELSAELFAISDAGCKDEVQFPS